MRARFVLSLGRHYILEFVFVVIVLQAVAYNLQLKFHSTKVKSPYMETNGLKVTVGVSQESPLVYLKFI